MKKRLLTFTERYESSIVIFLLVLLMIVVLLGTVGLAVLIGATIVQRLGALDISDMKFTMPLLHEAFKGFLMILIGLELMKTVVMYLEKHVVHVEVVMSVAMIAIARHVIDLNLETLQPLSLIGTGAIILALAVGYFYFKRAGNLEAQNQADGEGT